MPYIELVTNISLTQEKKQDLALQLSSAAAKILSKPPASFGVNVRAGEVLSFAGNFDPCFQLRITALNIFSPENNIGYAKGFSEFLKEKLGLESDRGYITFYDPTDPNIGFKGMTMAEVRKMKK